MKYYLEYSNSGIKLARTKLVTMPQKGSNAIEQCWLQVLDADQAAFPDFLIKVLPCMDAGIEGDNVALVQSPQVLLLEVLCSRQTSGAL